MTVPTTQVRRLPARLTAALAIAWAVSAVLSPPATAADDGSVGATIDHAQPATGEVRLLVSVPGEEPVDLDTVQVTIDGSQVTSRAVTADSSDAVRRTTVLAIDTSQSMAGDRIAEARKAATAYLDLVPANVAVGVLTFDKEVNLVVPPTRDRDAARRAISGLKLAHDTALYDGVLGALDALDADGAAGQRTALVLSDGKDTTATPLVAVTDAIQTAGVKVDVVALEQGGQGTTPLEEIARAGGGTAIDADDPTALTDVFAGEADALARQVVVTAEVPDGNATSADVAVSATSAGHEYTASAYLPVRRSATAKQQAPAPPQRVGAGLFDLPREAMLGGVGAIGVGLLGVVLALAIGKPRKSKETLLAEQMSAYGADAAEFGRPATKKYDDEAGLADHARHAAERALANNRSLEAKIAHALEGAGMSLKPAEWLLLHGGVAIGSALIGALLGAGSIVLGILCFFLGAVGPWIYLSLKKSRRIRAFNTSLADTLQLMSGSLSAGLSLAQSIDTIVREGTEPIASEFRRVVVESRLGVAIEDSLEGVAARMDSQDFHWVVMAIRIQRDVGGNLAELLTTVAATLRERDYLRRHVKALSAEGRLSTYVLGGLPPGFLLYLTLTKPDYVMPMYTRPLGWLMCGAIAVLLSVGVFWMSKVSKVEL